MGDRGDVAFALVAGHCWLGVVIDVVVVEEEYLAH